jgi:hypothetical protein
MSAKQRCVHHSKTCCQTSLEHFYTFISTGCEKVEEVFESLTTKWFPIMRYIHPLSILYNAHGTILTMWCICFSCYDPNYDFTGRGDLQLPVQLVPITTKVVSSNPAQVRCTRYNII